MVNIWKVKLRKRNFSILQVSLSLDKPHQDKVEEKIQKACPGHLAGLRMDAEAGEQCRARG